MKRLAVIGLLVVLAACEGPASVRTQNAIAIACDGYAVMLTEATRWKARMTPDMVAKIDAANDRVDKVCLPDSELTTDSIAVVNQGTALLSQIMEVVRGI